jgi:hypothetical protein
MSNKGNTGNSFLDNILNSNRGGSFPPPNNPPDHSTMGIIVSNRNNNQENTSILTNIGNNPNNTSVETPQGLIGRLLYVSTYGKHYLAFVNDRDGELLTQFQRNNLDTCSIEEIPRGSLGTAPALNLEGCSDVVPHIDGKKEGVWIPDVRKPFDSLKDHRGNNFKPVDGKIFIFKSLR